MVIEQEALYNQLLEDHGLRKTTFRKEMLAIFMSHEGKAITSNTIEAALGDFDRITLYRTLKSFEDKGLVHIALDASGRSRYALCRHQCDEDEHHDSHAHFHCHTCGSTTCLDDMPDRLIQLVPDGYKVKDVQITYSGVCHQCT